MKITLALLALASACTVGQNTAITQTFNYFNTGSATGCEHRHHYLYDYKGSNCVWTSDKQKVTHPHGYDKMFTTFKMAEYGNLEDNDFLKVELKTCKQANKNSCGSWYQTVKLQDDVLGWRWTTVNGSPTSGTFNGKSDWKNNAVAINPEDGYVQIRITLQSNHDIKERHLADSMTVWASCRASTPSPTSYPTTKPTAYPTPKPTAYPTTYPTTFPTPFPTPYPTHHCPVTCEVKNAYSKCTGNKKLTKTFNYFNTGKATGCEHRHHYLYDYKGSDCIWTSDAQAITHPHGYDKLFTTFMMREYGNLEDNDFLKVQLQLGNSKKEFGPWYETVKLQDDVLGWRWTSVKGAPFNGNFNGKSDWKNTAVSIGMHDRFVKIRIQLRSSQSYLERHIADAMTVWASCATTAPGKYIKVTHNRAKMHGVDYNIKHRCYQSGSQCKCMCM